MAWIRVIDEDDAGPALEAAYSTMVDRESGRVDNIMKIHSLHVGGLQGHHSLYTAVMRGTPTLRKVEREMLALVVSRVNDCHY